MIVAVKKRDDLGKEGVLMTGWLFREECRTYF